MDSKAKVGVDVVSVQRASMLRMGQNWQKLGKINQAIDTYLRIIQDNPDTTESEEAKAALIEIAAGFEQEGRYYLAIDIYDRLSASVAHDAA